MPPSPSQHAADALLINGQSLRSIRHHIHQNPELCYEEHQTADFIAAALDALAIPYERGLGGTGIVATLTGSGSRDAGQAPVIGFRAELDALPLTEQNDFAHRSLVQGKKHGCGHDGHMTMLLGLAAWLSQNRDFAGTVRFIFQPAEEGGAGARRMIEDGLLEAFPMDRIFSLHNWPDLPAGTVGVMPGPIMAGGQMIEVTVRGQGGHGATPYACTDQLNIAVQILNQMHVFMARRLPPFSPAVLTITRFTGGEAMNVIPDQVHFDGTIRILDDVAANIIRTELPSLIEGIARSWGVEADVTLTDFYPVTSSNASAAELVETAARNIGLKVETSATGLRPAMTSEDFSFLLQKVPGCYFWLGQGGEHGLHHPSYDFNDDVLPTGVMLYAEIARLALDQGKIDG
ncbi:amidohydrolase [Tianweitania sp. BSSL-BM11]|uniref:Amidohydrolase n=1 Tax=Tianweitania aestuarii TaxID=2814886 RepID=A0ABS5RX80_9HYPH|nr:amidohydrolase [Tianweitania aestuarii]MBS9721624.1 amidohydrolase [Tianweitania aestuarii]